VHPFSEAILVGVIGLIGRALVALFSGVFSMIGLIISKDQKLSAFRQAWIDALREDISSFAAHAIMISAYCQAVFKPIKEKFEAGTMGAEEYLKHTKEYFEAVRNDYLGNLPLLMLA
jgi:hypothetical protein